MRTRPTDWIPRARNSRGFGVHSPLAFRIVRDALDLRNGTLWYAEETVDGAIPGNRARERFLRRVIRVGELLNPLDCLSIAFSDTGFSEQTARACAAICPDDSREHIVERLIVDAGGDLFLDAADPLFSAPGWALVTATKDYGNLRHFRSQLKNGTIMLEGDRHFLIICLENTASPTYKVFF